MISRADQLISLNDTSLLDVTVTHARRLLDRLSGGKVTLQVVRPKKVEALVKLLVAATIEETDKFHQPNKW